MNRPRLFTAQLPSRVKVNPFTKNVCVLLPLIAPRVKAATVGLVSSVMV
jgi:hypothetical protein